MKKNVSSQTVGVQMVSATDGSAFTGSVTVYVTGDGGTQAVGSVSSGACTHEGNGFHTYVPAQAETNYAHVAFTFIGTGAVPATVQVYTSFPQTVDNATNISAIKTKTDYLPSATAGAAGGIFIAGSNAATTVNFTGSLSGSVGSVTAAITLPTIPTNWISATGIASSAITSAKFASGAITATTIAADAIGASELATDAVTEIVAAVWAAAARTLTAATNFNNLSQSDIRTAVGMASANLDTQFTTLGGKLPSALVGGRMDANMSAVAGSATAATNLSESALGIVPGACEGTPTTSVIQTDLAEATDDHYIGRVIVFTSGAAAGEASNITDYVGSTGTVTIAPVTTAPSATDKFVIV